MPLLELPPDIFKDITSFLVGSEGLKHAVKYRGVCRTFKQYITAELYEQATMVPLEELFGSQQLKNILHSQHFALSQGVKTKKSQESPRFQCTFRIWTMLIALWPVSLELRLKGKKDSTALVLIPKMQVITPAIAAAFNDSDTLLQHVNTGSHLLKPACKALPNALDAATISGCSRSLSTIITCLLRQARSDSAPGQGKVCDVALAVVSSLRLAIRLRKPRAAHVLFDYIVGNKMLLLSTSNNLADDLLEYCIKYTYLALLPRVFHLRYGCFITSIEGAVRNWIVNSDDYHHLYIYGGVKTLQFFLKHKIVDPNTHSPYSPTRTDITPLMLALRNKRYDLARVLIENGADVNAKSKDGTGESALMFAVEHGYYQDVQFLLVRGEISLTKSVYDEAYKIAYNNGWGRCAMLIEKAKKQGAESIRHLTFRNRHVDEKGELHLVWLGLDD
ncbi:hypothetical protein COCVIDRAFT_35948 [Bipolaris victoriae FI3]|uniref:Uncharacterized protein n=1 Tax=Bipolaris victoriae (strain FI3) TaxID=930091 RepID=W7ESN0_BIPV3|nr:hypothetical protein COCVIDRAFT_35948 [Bipolaris victoriae FI3]